MQDKIGQVYIARLSGMNKNKIFMELENYSSNEDLSSKSSKNCEDLIF